MTRSNGNWEARFSNISYNLAKEIAKDKNIKEISLYQRLGVSDENYSDEESVTVKFDVRAYDENALKNANIHLTEGVLPRNTGEILLSLSAANNNLLHEKIKIGDKFKVMINGTIKEYTVVRQNTKFGFW